MPAGGRAGPSPLAACRAITKNACYPAAAAYRLFCFAAVWPLHMLCRGGASCSAFKGYGNRLKSKTNCCGCSSSVQWADAEQLAIGPSLRSALEWGVQARGARGTQVACACTRILQSMYPPQLKKGILLHTSKIKHVICCNGMKPQPGPQPDLRHNIKHL